MTSVNNALRSSNEQTLAKAVKDHAVVSRVLSVMDDLGVAVSKVYPHGYCASQSVYIDSGSTTPAQLHKAIPPVPLVALTGNSHTVKPASLVRVQEWTDNDIEPALPVILRTNATDSKAAWWTSLEGDGLLEVQCDKVTNLFAWLPGNYQAAPDSTTVIAYYGGSGIQYVPHPFKPVAKNPLPITKLAEFEAQATEAAKHWVRGTLSTVTQAMWNWKKRSKTDNQIALQSALLTARGDIGRASSDVQAEVLQVLSLVEANIEQWMLETDAYLAKAVELVTNLVEEKGVLSKHKRMPEYLSQLIAEKLGVTGVKVYVAVERNRMNCSVGTPSRSLFAPREWSMSINSDFTVRLQDVGVSFAY